MKVTLWGTRGSIAAPGPETNRYGGNTSCVQVVGPEGTWLVLDAGTGIRRLGGRVPPEVKRVDVLLTHLHMDHLQGLGFFGPLYNPHMTVHIWGPASVAHTLRDRLNRYLSPPLFPVLLRDLPCKLELHEVPCGRFNIGEFALDASLVCHPGPTVGYRVGTAGAALAYIPDHEPRLCAVPRPVNGDWTSGFGIAREADLLIHDSQYNRAEYQARVGWGHSSIADALEFAATARVRHFVPFHHDPAHSDADLDDFFSRAMAECQPEFRVTPGSEGTTFDL